MTKDEALKLALEALETCDFVYTYGNGGYQQFNRPSVDKAITAIKQALAAPVQEPVAWMQSDEVHISLWKDDYHTIPLYTTPPAAQRQWDYDTLHAAWHAVGADVAGLNWDTFVAKLKEKTT
jgi:hypothetical protein